MVLPESTALIFALFQKDSRGGGSGEVVALIKINHVVKVTTMEVKWFILLRKTFIHASQSVVMD